jgi:putative ABC transport system permease protein
MHPLLRVALALSPLEFRRRFSAQIAADQREYRGAALVGACWDVLVAGCLMHLENVFRDLTFSVRSLAKAPAYACIAILAFGLAIGANVAVASVLDAVVLRPLPFPHGDRLVFVSQGPNLRTQISYRNARDIEARNTTLDSIALQRESVATLSGHGRPAILHGWTVDASYFHVLGVPPELGRELDARDLSTSNIVISHRAWRKYFNGDTRVLGKVLRMDGHDYTVVGVMPADFRDPAPTGLQLLDFWMPVDKHSILAGSRVWTGFHGIARLARHASVQSATADLRRILDAIAAKDPQDFIDARGVTVVPVLEGIVGNTRTLLWMLYAAVGMVLLIACVNIANLTMARTAAREREIVVRTALGAARARIVTQLLSEFAVLALCGGVMGTAIAYGILHVLQSVFAQVLPRWEDVSLNAPMLAYAFGVVVFTTITAGLLPAFGGARDMAPALKNAGRSGDRGAGRRTREALVIVEVALAVAIVVSAGLVLRSFVVLTHVQLGFNPDNLSVVTVTLPYDKYYSDPNAAAAAAHRVTLFSDRLVNGLRSTPGVANAASAIILPFEWNTYPRAFTIPGRPDPHATVTTNAISSRFFGTMQIPLVRGRDFGTQDTAAASTAIVNAAFAERYFGTLDVVGKQVALTPFDGSKAIPQTIVGVAGNTRTSFSRPPEPQLYIPDKQISLALFYVVRTSNARFALGPAAAAVLARIDPRVAPPSVESYRILLDRDAVRSQAAMLLFGILAILALILALSGIYAVTAYSVEQRTQEFGIRQAIGAHASDVLRDVLRGAMLQTSAGIAAGIAIAALFGRFLSGLLYETSPLDPGTFIAVVALTIGAVVAAAAIPAVRAARIQPAAAIRYE